MERKPLALAIRAYQRWAPARIKGHCPGPAMGQPHCSAYGLQLARELPARKALPLILARLREHTDGPHNPAWYRKLSGRRWLAAGALAVIAAGGGSDHGGSTPTPVNSPYAAGHSVVHTVVAKAGTALSVAALVGLALGGQSESNSPLNAGNPGSPGNMPGPVIVTCPAGQHLNHRHDVCREDIPPQND